MVLAGCATDPQSNDAADGFVATQEALTTRIEAEAQACTPSSGDSTSASSTTLRLSANASGDTFKFSTTVASGTYAVTLRFAQRNIYGNYQVYINGTAVGTLSGYSSNTSDTWTTLSLGTRTLSGSVEFKFISTGKDSAATDFDAKLDYIELTSSSAGTGGASSTGGTTAKGGAVSTGGAVGTGGRVSTGGAVGTGGRVSTGGAVGTGGRVSTGGAPGTGGSTINPGQCSATTTPVARHGKLSIKDGKLVNQCGRPVQLTSMSMYDWSQQGRQYYNATAVKNLLQDKKCASLRIPLLASNYPSEYPRIKTVLDACVANGIYCIPNWHVIGSSNVANAKAFYVQLAKDYGNTPNIIYEPWNEPTSDSWATIKAYMEQIIAAVRPIDPDGIFLAGNSQWDQRPDQACANPIADPNVGYVFHFYAASHTLSGFQNALNSCMNAKKLIWSTEYGGCSSSGNGAINTTEVNRWWTFMDQNLISSNAWALETNGETSSVFVGNASATGPWPDSQLTTWGKLVFAHIAKNYPITMSQ
jgi:hypothetical protein